MTDAERQALTVGEVVYYLDDKGEYHRATIRIAPWKNALDNWLIVFENDPLRCFDLTLVIGRDLADCDAHRIVTWWEATAVIPNSKVALESLRDQIAAAIRAGEVRGWCEAVGPGKAREMGDVLRAAKGPTPAQLLASQPAPPEVIAALGAAVEAYSHEESP